jgi:hypothetical protein
MAIQRPGKSLEFPLSTCIVLGDHIKFFEMVRVRPAGSCTACAPSKFGGCNKEDENFRHCFFWEQQLGGGLCYQFF